MSKSDCQDESPVLIPDEEGLFRRLMSRPDRLNDMPYGDNDPIINHPNPKQKFGDAKVPLHLIPSSAEVYLALGHQDGAKKYGPFNWRITKVEAMTYIGALRRHIAAWVDGEEWASDSGKPHLAHAMTCLSILADAIETGNLIDNRPPKGNAAHLLKKWEKEVD